MIIGYACEDCREYVRLTATFADMRWLRERQHVVREVAGHLHGGLDTWMTEALEFLDRHGDHAIVFHEA